MKTHFTHHAYERIGERVRISPEQLARLIDNDLTVPLGMEPGRTRIHRLFYSHIDEQCFVIIQDERTGSVITVLPVDYHERIAWKISLTAQQMARSLVYANQKPMHTPTANLFN